MDDEETLINLVRDYRELYDPEFKQYHDFARREAAWLEISKKLQLPVHECKDKWKRLRDNYRKAKKLRDYKKRHGITNIRSIKHEKIISFVQPLREVRRGDKDSSVDGDEDCESAESSSDFQKERQDYAPSPLHADPLVDPDRRNNAEESQKPDTVVTFFTNLGETVKTFPEDIQIRVKREIFKIVNEAEEEVCRRNNDDNVLVKFEISDI